MALFTKFKKAKEAAVEHKKNATAQQAKPPPTPYKHIPTHAAQDALSSQPTTVRPEELQARIAAARKRKANSYQPPMTARHSIYHSCESSRASSRASSSMGLLPPPSSTSLKGKGNSNEAIDAIMRRSLSTSYRHSTPVAGRQLQSSELFPPGLVGRPPFPPLANQRPRPPRASSRRSSFTKKKSPLSTVSSDEEPEETLSSSSNASARSTQSSASDEPKRIITSDNGTGEATTAELPQPAKQTIVVDTPRIADTPLVRPKSKWSLLSRRNIDIAAH